MLTQNSFLSVYIIPYAKHTINTYAQAQVKFYDRGILNASEFSNKERKSTWDEEKKERIKDLSKFSTGEDIEIFIGLFFPHSGFADKK